MIVPYLLFGRWETQLWVILKSWSESQTGVSDKHKVKPLAEYRNHFGLSRTLAFIIIKAPRLVMTRPVITDPLSHAAINTVADRPTTPFGLQWWPVVLDWVKVGSANWLELRKSINNIAESGLIRLIRRGVFVKLFK